MTSPAPTVQVQQICGFHQSQLIHGVLNYRRSDPWQAAIITCNLLLTRLQLHDPRVIARTAGRTEDLSLVLAELGAPCCAIRLGQWKRIKKVMAKGLNHAAAVAQGRVADPMFEQAIALWKTEGRADA